MGNWSNNWPSSDNSTTNMPDQTDGVDIAHSSTIEALRDAQLGNENILGNSTSPAAGTLQERKDHNIQDDVAGQIAAITAKGSPVATDILLIEDSADSNNKKRVTVGSFTSASIPGEQLSSYANLPTALASIGSAETTLWIDANDTIASNVVVPATISLQWIRGFELTINNTFTLTINGSINEANYKIFDTSPGGTIVFGGTGVARINPKWFGATGDGTTDDAAAIDEADAAAAAVGLHLHFPSGTYLFNSSQTLTSTLDLCEGVLLKVGNTYTLRIDGLIEAGAHQIFDTSLGGAIDFATSDQRVLEGAWWFNCTESCPAAGSTLPTEILVRCNAAVGGSYTVTSNVTLNFIEDSIATLSAGVVLTINGSIKAPSRQIFDISAGSGAAVVFGAASHACVDANWFATLADAVTSLGTSTVSLLITQDMAVSDDLTVPSNITLKFHDGRSLTVADATYLDVQGAIVHDHRDAFLGNGEVSTRTGFVVRDARGDGHEIIPKTDGTLEIFSTDLLHELVPVASFSNLDPYLNGVAPIRQWRADGAAGVITDYGPALNPAGTGNALTDGGNQLPLFGSSDKVTQLNDGVVLAEDSAATVFGTKTQGRITLLFRTTDGIADNDYVMGTLLSNAVGNYGWAILVTPSTNYIDFVVRDNTNVAYLEAHGGTDFITGSYYLLDIFFDLSQSTAANSAAMYLNNVLVDTTDFSAISTVDDNTQRFTIGSRPYTSTASRGPLDIVFGRIYSADDLGYGGTTNATEWAALAAQEKARLQGISSYHSVDDLVPSTMTNTQETHIIRDAADGSRELVTCGKGWLDTCQVLVDGELKPTIRMANALTNRIPYSEDMTQWTPQDAGDTIAPTYVGAHGRAACSLIADSTDGDHRLAATVAGFTANDTVMVVVTKYADKDWAVVSIDSSDTYFYLGGASAYAGTPGASITAAKIKHFNGRYFIWLNTSFSTASRTVYVGAAVTDGDYTFAGDGVTENIGVDLVQCINATIPVDYIRTNGSAVSRAESSLVYDVPRLSAKLTDRVSFEWERVPFYPGLDLDNGAYEYVCTLHDGGGAPTDGIWFFDHYLNDSLYLAVYDSGGQVGSDTIAINSHDGELHKCFAEIGLDYARWGEFGVVTETPTGPTAIDFASMDELVIGNDFNGGNAGDGAAGLANLRIYRRRTR